MTEQKHHFDLEQITISEYRELFRDGTTDERQDEIIGKCAGLTAEQVGALPFLEWQRLVRSFYAAVRKERENPN